MFTFLNVVVSVEKLNTSQYFLNHFSMFSQYAFHLFVLSVSQCVTMIMQLVKIPVL